MKAVFTKEKIISVLKLVALIGVGLIINRLLQSYLGQLALDDTGLEVLALEEALVVAEQTDRLVLADMSAIWCPSCRKLDKEVLSDPEVKEIVNTSYVFSRIEYESKEGEAFMKKYKVNGFPTVLVLNHEGRKLAHLPLTFDPTKFESLLQQATNRFN